jgi:predicted transcriptional regulator
MRCALEALASERLHIVEVHHAMDVRRGRYLLFKMMLDRGWVKTEANYADTYVHITEAGREALAASHT